MTRHDAARAIDACRRFGMVLALDENNPFWPNTQEMQRIVASGELGEPMHIEGNTSNENSGRFFGAWRHLDAESPGGGMTGAGIHMLDAFIHLMGPVQSVNAQLVTRKPPPDPTDMLSAMFRFASGATGVVRNAGLDTKLSSGARVRPCRLPGSPV